MNDDRYDVNQFSFHDWDARRDLNMKIVGI